MTEADHIAPVKEHVQQGALVAERQAMKTPPGVDSRLCIG